MQAHRKPNAAIDVDLQTQAAAMRVALEKAERILALKEHDGWIAFMEDVDTQLEHVEFKLDSFEKMTDIERAVNLKERKDLRWIKEAMTRTETALPRLAGALAATEAKLVERRQRDGQIA
jgi:DNA polymerase II large subunit